MSGHKPFRTLREWLREAQNVVSCPSCLGLWKRRPGERGNGSCPDAWHIDGTSDD